MVFSVVRESEYADAAPTCRVHAESTRSGANVRRTFASVHTNIRRDANVILSRAADHDVPHTVAVIAPPSQRCVLRPGRLTFPFQQFPGVEVEITAGATVQVSVQRFTVAVAPGLANLTVTLGGGTGDADLHMRANAHAEPGASDCFSLTFDTTTESCSIDAPQSGTWYIRVNGPTSFAGVALTATVQ